jgi:hypothetical protein
MKLKLTLLIVLLYTITNSFFAGDGVTVVHVKGKIYNENTKKYINLGDVISVSDKLSVESTDANCFVLNVEKSKLSLNPSVKKGSVNELFVGVPDRKPMTTRGDGDSAIIKFADYFGIGTYVFIDTVENLKLSSEYFKLSKPSSFLVSYKSVEGKEIKKKLELKTDVLTINILPFLNQNSNDSILKLDIFQVFIENGQFKKHHTIDLKYISFDQMKSELKFFGSLLDNSKSQDELFNEMYAFVLDIYGNVSKTVLKSKLIQSGILK